MNFFLVILLIYAIHEAKGILNRRQVAFPGGVAVAAAAGLSPVARQQVIITKTVVVQQPAWGMGAALNHAAANQARLQQQHRKKERQKKMRQRKNRARKNRLRQQRLRNKKKLAGARKTSAAEVEEDEEESSEEEEDKPTPKLPKQLDITTIPPLTAPPSKAAGGLFGAGAAALTGSLGNNNNNAPIPPPPSSLQGAPPPPNFPTSFGENRGFSGGDSQMPSAAFAQNNNGGPPPPIPPQANLPNPPIEPTATLASPRGFPGVDPDAPQFAGNREFGGNNQPNFNGNNNNGPIPPPFDAFNNNNGESSTLASARGFPSVDPDEQLGGDGQSPFSRNDGPAPPPLALTESSTSSPQDGPSTLASARGFPSVDPDSIGSDSFATSSAPLQPKNNAGGNLFGGVNPNTFAPPPSLNSQSADKSAVAATTSSSTFNTPKEAITPSIPSPPMSK